ncbi:MAG TPA: chorismate synthase [Bdellovibrionota bacterium]|jgi:chorismate synthase
MNGNRFGTIFQVTTWGESHGPALGAVVDGCPSGLALDPEDFLADMQRRQGGKSGFTTPRQEADRVTIESGVFEGRTTGCPISLRIENSAQRPADYEELRHRPRPGHADLTTQLKHGHRDHRGGGRSSARETASRVAAGVVAKKLLQKFGVELLAWIESAGPNTLTIDQKAEASALPLAKLRGALGENEIGVPFSCGKDWAHAALALKDKGDSWGGAVRCRVDGLPVGLGEPVFDKLGALLSHALMSLPAAVAFEAGGGLAMAQLPGSQIRDPIAVTPAGPRPSGNKHGGLLGGLSTGLPLLLGVSFHAPTSIPEAISTVDFRNNREVEIRVGGRHDSFPLPRILPVVEAMVAITLADSLLRAGRIPETL